MAQDQFVLTNGKGEKIVILDFLIIKNVIKYLLLLLLMLFVLQIFNPSHLNL